MWSESGAQKSSKLLTIIHSSDHSSDYVNLGEFVARRMIIVFVSHEQSSRELATRFQMIFGTYMLRPKALSPKRAARPPHHPDPGASHSPRDQNGTAQAQTKHTHFDLRDSLHSGLCEQDQSKTETGHRESRGPALGGASRVPVVLTCALCFGPTSCACKQ